MYIFQICPNETMETFIDWNLHIQSDLHAVVSIIYVGIRLSKKQVSSDLH